MASLPFLTLPDPLVAGEGSLDPLGLAMVADRLAEEMLPGMRARMSRPRFLTAIAVSAAVCEGLEDQYASDGITPAYLVFEWLAVEAFVRALEHDEAVGTPGILKARDALSRHDAMCARTYLKTPTVFGFHGVYKPLARNLGIIDHDLRLADRGYELLQAWQSEQGLAAFLGGSQDDGPGRALRQTLRDAVEESLVASRTQRSGGWRGWQMLATHLRPAGMKSEESDVIRRLLSDPGAASRGEVLGILFQTKKGLDLSEDEVARSHLLPKAKAELRKRLEAITAYEKLCTALEEAFDWVRYLSTCSIGRPITRTLVAKNSRVTEIAKGLAKHIHGAESALAASPLLTQQRLSSLVNSFNCVSDAEELFEALLLRHERVQAGKPPENTKRSWFERSSDGGTFVRPPYRFPRPPAAERGWSRPYRIGAASSFVNDLEIAYS